MELWVGGAPGGWGSGWVGLWEGGAPGWAECQGGRGSGGHTAVPKVEVGSWWDGSPCPTLAPIRGCLSPSAQRAEARVEGDRVASADTCAPAAPRPCFSSISVPSAQVS